MSGDPCNPILSFTRLSLKRVHWRFFKTITSSENPAKILAYHSQTEKEKMPAQMVTHLSWLRNFSHLANTSKNQK